MLGLNNQKMQAKRWGTLEEEEEEEEMAVEMQDFCFGSLTFGMHVMYPSGDVE